MNGKQCPWFGRDKKHHNTHRFAIEVSTVNFHVAETSEACQNQKFARLVNVVKVSYETDIFYFFISIYDLTDYLNASTAVYTYILP